MLVKLFEWNGTRNLSVSSQFQSFYPLLHLQESCNNGPKNPTLLRLNIKENFGGIICMVVLLDNNFLCCCALPRHLSEMCGQPDASTHDHTLHLYRQRKISCLPQPFQLKCISMPPQQCFKNDVDDEVMWMCLQRRAGRLLFKKHTRVLWHVDRCHKAMLPDWNTTSKQIELLQKRTLTVLSLMKSVWYVPILPL